MVAGLIDHFNLGIGILSIRSTGDNFAWSADKQVSRDKWNPLLIAIASQKEEIVRWLMQEQNISLRHAGINNTDFGIPFSDNSE